MIDCFDGLVVSWSMGTRPDAELVNTMLDAAVESVADNEHRPVVRTDRGAHCRWPGWLARLVSPDRRREAGSLDVAQRVLA